MRADSCRDEIPVNRLCPSSDGIGARVWTAQPRSGGAPWRPLLPGRGERGSRVAALYPPLRRSRWCRPAAHARSRRRGCPASRQPGRGPAVRRRPGGLGSPLGERLRSPQRAVGASPGSSGPSASSCGRCRAMGECRRREGLPLLVERGLCPAGIRAFPLYSRITPGLCPSALSWHGLAQGCAGRRASRWCGAWEDGVRHVPLEKLVRASLGWPLFFVSGAVQDSLAPHCACF